MTPAHMRVTVWILAIVLAVWLLTRSHIIPAVLVVAFVASPFDDMLIAAAYATAH